MKQLTLALLLLLLGFSCAGAELPPALGSVEGTWLGSLPLPGTQLRIVFHIAKSASGWTATLDSPDQGAFGIGIDHVDWDNESVTLVCSRIHGQFSGRLGAGGAQLAGTWTQASLALPLVLKRVDHVDAPVRPQTPQRPFPYLEENVIFDAQPPGVRLAGTLTYPKSGSPRPAVVLIAGSGPEHRDEEVAGHKVFLVLSDYLTRRGFVVLRYDKRGVGRSTGNYHTATTADFANDARAALTFLRSRKEVDPSRVGLLGHSEGGVIAPIVAANNPEVAFVILIGGPGVTGEKILLAQQEAIGRASGLPDAKLEEARASSEQAYALVRSEKDPAVLKSKLISLFADNPAAKLQIGMLLSPWFRYFLTLDPQPILRRVSCPVLAVDGALDLQVPAGENLPAVEAALRSGGNQDVTAAALPGLNHLLQEAKTGSPGEYAKIEQTMSPAALAMIADWIARHTQNAHSPHSLSP